MPKFTVIPLACVDVTKYEVVADRFQVTAGGTLLFWNNPADDDIPNISVATFAAGTWSICHPTEAK